VPFEIWVGPTPDNPLGAGNVKIPNPYTDAVFNPLIFDLENDVTARYVSQLQGTYSENIDFMHIFLPFMRCRIEIAKSLFGRRGVSPTLDDAFRMLPYCWLSTFAQFGAPLKSMSAQIAEAMHKVWKYFYTHNTQNGGGSGALTREQRWINDIHATMARSHLRRMYRSFDGPKASSPYDDSNLALGVAACLAGTNVDELPLEQQAALQYLITGPVTADAFCRLVFDKAPAPVVVGVDIVPHIAPATRASRSASTGGSAAAAAAVLSPTSEARASIVSPSARAARSAPKRPLPPPLSISEDESVAAPPPPSPVRRRYQHATRASTTSAAAAATAAAAHPPGFGLEVDIDSEDEDVDASAMSPAPVPHPVSTRSKTMEFPCRSICITGQAFTAPSATFVARFQAAGDLNMAFERRGGKYSQTDQLAINMHAIAGVCAVADADNNVVGFKILINEPVTQLRKVRTSEAEAKCSGSYEDRVNSLSSLVSVKQPAMSVGASSSSNAVALTTVPRGAPPPGQCTVT
jgi:hypothetical protein